MNRSEIIKKLQELSKDVAPSGLNYISGVDDAEKNYCDSCVKFKLKHVKKKAKKTDRDYIYSGKPHGAEEDGPCMCCACFVPLDVALSDEGIGCEETHFIENGISGIDKMTAFELLRIYEGITDERVTSDLDLIVISAIEDAA